MHAVEYRLHQIIGIALRRPLTSAEARDMKESHQYIENRGWRLGQVLNFMQMAIHTKDWQWFAELSEEYQKVMRLY